MFLILAYFSFAWVFHGDAELLGVDVSQPVLPWEFTCLYEMGFRFAVVRIFQGHPAPLNQPDIYCVTSINSAWEAGMHFVDGYIFPCFYCGHPEDQVERAINFVRNNTRHGIRSLWLDVEGFSRGFWSKNNQENIDFIKRLISQAQTMGFPSVGIYASPYVWRDITGNSTAFNAQPLWYAHWDHDPGFKDWDKFHFGGWRTPTMKQFFGNGFACHSGIDKNIRFFL